MELTAPSNPSKPSKWPRLRRRALPRRVLIAHNPVGPQDDPSTSDVLAQVELVERALAELRVPAARLAVADWRVWEDLAAAAPGPGTMVFNLVEAPPSVPSVHPATAAVLELLGLPFSGSSAACLWLTTDKLATRAVLAAHGLPVAPGGRLDRDDLTVLDRVPGPWILKPSCEDASLGLDGAAVCATRQAALARAAELLNRFPGQPLVAETYLPGRELNVSLLAGGPLRAAAERAAAPGILAAPIVPAHPAHSTRPIHPAHREVTALPVAEIAFVDFPPDMPRIVGYEAKWHPESFAYTHTVRQFPDDSAAAPLLDHLRHLALAAWRACGLTGYGRVDFRLDAHGAPHILEVNANPCLAAEAGFIAAAEQAGLTPAAVIARILTAAQERQRTSALNAARSALSQLAPAVSAAAGA